MNSVWGLRVVKSDGGLPGVKFVGGLRVLTFTIIDPLTLEVQVLDSHVSFSPRLFFDNLIGYYYEDG